MICFGCSYSLFDHKKLEWKMVNVEKISTELFGKQLIWTTRVGKESILSLLFKWPCPPCVWWLIQFISGIFFVHVSVSRACYFYVNCDLSIISCDQPDGELKHIYHVFFPPDDFNPLPCLLARASNWCLDRTPLSHEIEPYTYKSQLIPRMVWFVLCSYKWIVDVFMSWR